MENEKQPSRPGNHPWLHRLIQNVDVSGGDHQCFAEGAAAQGSVGQEAIIARVHVLGSELQPKASISCRLGRKLEKSRMLAKSYASPFQDKQVWLDPGPGENFLHRDPICLQLFAHAPCPDSIDGGRAGHMSPSAWQANEGGQRRMYTFFRTD